MKVTWLEEIPESERWIVNDQPFTLDGTEYIATMRHRSKSPRLSVKKPPELVERTVRLLEVHRGSNIFEIGISQGGSTALFAQVAEPRKLVAVELDPEPVRELEAFIEHEGLGAVVKPHYGVDQADRARLREILDREFGDEQLDLVVDDASHLLDETRSSFETIFPRLREGGLFIIEDWNWEHLKSESLHAEVSKPDSPLRAEFDARLKEALSDPDSEEHAAFAEWLVEREKHGEAAATPRVAGRPLTILVIELLLARAWSGDIISEITVSDLWVTIRRGPAELDPETFRVADITHDRFGLLPRERGA
jgi:predicted O-methyltransferase YrrM